jgi:antitoxin (DNA-binding transcriptional repressor) of toxin-antitoxin stability system
MVRMSATEVARSFSSVVNRVGAGEEVEIVRNGVAVAELRPVQAPRGITADRWDELMESAPPLDGDFARDVMRGRESFGPPSGVWPS